MAIQTIRPNATVSNTFTVVGASAHVATNDDSDTTYVDATAGAFKEILLDMASYTIPAGKYIKQARVKLRYRTNTPGFMTLWYSRFADTSGRAGTADAHNDIQASAVTNTGPWRTVAPDGQPWGQTQIDTIRFNAYLGYWYTNFQQPRIYEVYIELDENSNPVAAISSPANLSTITTTTQPFIIFGYSDADGDQMDAYQIKVFSAAQYGVGGFNIWTSPSTWDSGKVFATNPPVAGVQVGVQLAQGTTYRAYVIVYQAGAGAGPGNGISSSATNTQFTINVTPPAVPSITSVVADATLGRITVNYRANDALTQFLTLERSIDAGVNWTPTRNGSSLASAGNGVIVAFQDYEVTPGKSAIYRIRGRYVASGQTITGAYSASSGAVTLTDSEWRLKSPTDPTLNIVLFVIGDKFSQRKPEDKATFNPLGRTRKVTVADTIKGEEGSITLEFLTDATYQAFEALRNRQETLLLVRGWTTEQFYISLGEVRDTDLFNYGPNLYRQVTMDWVEVDSGLGTI